ncbi:MAG TPA: serine hydrolase domain-containing protein [Kofleriaceae bacterium]|nr:serine hydrolase domain-containing protein [Kofleriaceae bacterium]
MKKSFLLLLAAACRVAAPTDPDPALELVPPSGWTVERHVFRDPDHALRVIVAATDQDDPRLAIAEQWAGRAPEVLLATPALDEPPPDGGWDREVNVEYALPAAKAREVRAQYRRFRDRRYVILIDGDSKALAKRDAQIDTLLGSLKPAGMQEEKLAGPARVPEVAQLDAFTTRALTELEVPGAAIGVIVDGKVVYERVLGVRTLGDPAQITTDTRFLLASVTKPMTTFMEAALVDAGTVAWDTPVTTLLPTFALADAAITKQLRLWHMSCACTGMPRQDMEGLFEWDGVTPEARIAVMKTMRPTTKLGETFQYSNPMVAAGGFAAAHAFAPALPLAQAYAAAMQSKVFGPIGMTSTTLDFATVAAGDHATPHALAIDGTTHAMPLAIERAVEPIAPAGAVWTSLHDLERYALTELADGVAPDGTRVVSAANVRERRIQRVREDATSGYGLGIDLEDYHGLHLVAHDGGAFGFGTTLYLFPDQHAGIVMLTNIRNGNAKAQLPYIEAVRRRIVEALFAGAKPLADKQLAYYVGLRTHASTPAMSPFGELAGHYHEPVLGDLELRDTPAGPVLDAGEWQTRVARVTEADGSAKLVNLDPPFAGGAFLIGPDHTLIVPDQTTYTFHRR